MERDIRINWETITEEARRRRESRGMTQGHLAALAKVSRSTLSRFENKSGDVQLSSVLRILGVLDMAEVGISEEAKRQAFRQLEQEGLTSVPQVHLSTDKLRQYWPIQFGGGANV